MAADAPPPVLAPVLEPSAAALEAGRRLFARPVSFVLGVAQLSQLPTADLPEVAFAGRSNVGKSSLINALVNRKGLARASNEPGRTRELNFFLLDDRVHVVDLPGYGFAKAPKTVVDRWTALTRDYLRGRARLKRVFLLIDSRRGLTAADEAVMDALDTAAVAYQVTLTKLDKCKPAEHPVLLSKTHARIAKRPAAHPHILTTSAAKRLGLDGLRAEIAALCTPRLDAAAFDASPATGSGGAL